MSISKIWIKLTALLLVFNLAVLGPIGYVWADDPSPAPSADTSSANSNTGSTSDNTSTTNTTQTSNTTDNNAAAVNNSTTGNVTSGSNNSTQNTGNATVNTSNSTANTSSNTTVNTNGVATSPSPSPSSDPWTTWTGDGDWSTRASNSTTGSNSTNTANNTANLTSNTTNNNAAAINNNTQVGSSTGSNNASQNTGDASIQTGNAATNTSTSNIANLNGNYWTGAGDWTSLWNGEAANYLTGHNSDNTAANNFNAVLNVLNQNGVNVNNLLNTSASSGSNNASQNTGNANITTGSSSLLSTLFNLANTNVFGAGAVNVLAQDVNGNYSGNIDLSGATPYSLASLLGNPLTLGSSNDKTGSGSTNTADNTGNLTLALTNNNNGNLTNNLNLLANSGGNAASDNTGNATVSTGDANIIGNLINMLNTNLFTNNLYFGEVNVYGNWLGNLILPDYPTSGVTTAGGGTAGAITAGNTMTGATSNNTANNTANTDLTQTNNNNGAVGNNIAVNSDTGHNTANDNTMNGTVQTGTSTAAANINNMTNTNVSSDSPWWLVVVNDLGHWIPILQNPETGAQIVLDGTTLSTGGSANLPITDAATGTGTTSSGNNLTGFGSNNTANNTSNETASITNNNAGTITNNIAATALTGGNDASRNTGSANITTGNTSVLLNILNFLNTNITSPSILITFVNVFGSWTGDVLNHGSTAAIPGSGGPDPVSITDTNPSQGGDVPSDNNSQSNDQNNDPSTQTGTVQGASTTSGGNVGSGNQIVAAFTSIGGSTTGKVLSFFEAKNPAGGGSGNQAVNSYTSPLQNMAIGFILAFILITLFRARRKAWKLLLKVKTINLF